MNVIRWRSENTMGKSLTACCQWCLLGLIFTACQEKVLDRQQGIASYYADYFQGKQTASGELYDTAAMTAAHREWPLGSVVRVTNPENNRTIEVVINDRGPYVDRRIIDLSKAAARELDFIEKGIVKVHLELLDKNNR